ncbi:MAG: AAA family ATPase [Methylobacter tundripaludum]|nr:AAA family ATPase [Methylobacter tundripaludum]
MKIKNLQLINFRCFENFILKPADRFTLLIGDNGSGKTAILDALAVAVGGFLLAIPNIKPSDKRPISRDDIRYENLSFGQTIIKETGFRGVLVVADGIVNNEDIRWTRTKDIKTTGGKPAADIIKLVETLAKDKTNRNTLFPVIAYYSTGRLWKQLKETEKKTQSPVSRFDGYQDCLNPASDQKRFFRWFRTQELAALQKQERRHTLEAVREVIVSMIPDAKRAWWDLDWDELLVETLVQGKLQTIPFHLLSDGYRNMIGMIADIAYRMATLNPQLEVGVIKQTEGIVLIDEIDLHLHPKWQKQVVERLLDTFPKVQFVASSHSPFIIQSLYHREDCLLWDLEKNAPVEVDSKSIEDIAENQQGVKIPQQSQRFLDMEKAAEEYYTVLKQIPTASEDEKQRLRQRLDELLLPYSDDPAFQAFLKMERQAVEGSAEE